MKHERRQKKALSTLTGRLLCGMLVLWLTGTALITWLEAEHYRDLTHRIAASYSELHSSSYSWYDHANIRVTQTSDPFLYSHLVTEHHFRSGNTADDRGLFYQPVVFLKNEEDELITKSSDFVFGPLSIGSDPPYLAAVLEREYFLSYDNGNPMFPTAYSPFWDGLRLTGRWEETSFHVLFMEYLDQGWHPLYQVPNADLTDAETVILDRFHLAEYPYGEPVTRGGTTYPNLSAYFAANPDDYGFLAENSLLDTIESSGQVFLAEDGKFYHQTVVVRTWPLCSAVYELKWLYAATFAGTALLTFLLHRTLKRRLIAPLRELNYKMSQNWMSPPLVTENTRYFDEICQLADHYADNQEILYRSEKELDRLNKALDYAKEAEENRRQMTSAIAHELKTPLAVIHSYTEGLQEHINEKKREQYLRVILSEVQRMDGMVLEMLDLSRLEAGKVKLAQDRFSLCDLTKATFERLSLAVEAKELDVTFDFRCDGMVTADEARIGQVLTNFITNAIKYTRFGGMVTVKVQQIDVRTFYTIENDCDPLPQEVLSRVWDTFYRADSARSGEGTGLGLAISRSIIELHGGTCTVQNTLSGVEFRFVI